MNRLDQRPHHLVPGRIEGVEDAPPGVAALEAEIDVIGVVGVGSQRESGAERDHVPHPPWTLLDDESHDVGVTETGSRDLGVGGVRVE